MRNAGWLDGDSMSPVRRQLEVFTRRGEQVAEPVDADDFARHLLDSDAELLVVRHEFALDDSA